MRATATSAANSSGVFQVRTAPPAVELDELSAAAGPVPISATSTAASEAETMQWAQGYSGCIGVSMNGVQPASRVAGSLPSRPFRIAVTGRQKLYVYLASNTAISASSIAMPATASRRALSVTSRPGAVATDRATGQ